MGIRNGEENLKQILSYTRNFSYTPKELQADVYLHHHISSNSRKTERMNVDFGDLAKNVSTIGKEMVEVALTMISAERLTGKSRSFSEIKFPSLIPNYWIECQHLFSTINLFLTRGTIKVNFYEYPAKSKQVPTDVSQLKKADCIVLFSGGLDSLATYYLAKQKFQNPIFVNVCLNTKIDRYLERIKKANLIPDLKFYSLNLIKKLPLQPPDSITHLQQTRGFVFLATAAMVAEIYDCDKIIVGETGPIMFQPRFSTTDIVTRTTHPVLLRLSEKLFSSIFQREFKIFAPFQDNTKAELISLLPENIKKNYMPYFDSCMMSREDGMCGACYSCVVRRLSSIVADANDNEFLNDITTTSNPAKLLHLTALLEFCMKVIQGSKAISQDVLDEIKEYDKQDLFTRFAKDILSAVYLITSRSNNQHSDFLERFSRKYLKEPNLIESLEKRIDYVRHFNDKQTGFSG